MASEIPVKIEAGRASNFGGTDTVALTNLSDFVASGVSHARGIVPDPGAVAGTTKFLREDATWQIPAGGGGGGASLGLMLAVASGNFL